MKRAFYRPISIAVLFLVSASAAACSLSGGSIDVLAGSDEDGSAGASDGATDGASPSDGNSSGDQNAMAPDGSVLDAGADAGPPPHFIFANTSTKAYALNLDDSSLHLLGPISACTDAGIDTFDLAQDSNGVLEALAWKASGSFLLYAMERDGGCIDVHGGAGTNPAGSSMWVGFQKGPASDTLYSVVDDNGTLFSYNAMGDFITSVNGVFSGGGATADIACTPTLCYTALTHDRCPSSSDNNDCLVSFTSAGANKTQVGNFEKAGIAGLAYDSGFIYGFATDGSITKISITGPSTGVAFPITGASAGMAWAGAASSSANK